MKKKALEKKLVALAKKHDVTFELIRQGGGHEIWSFNGQSIAIPRHREINELTAKSILKTANAEVSDGKEK